ncbi:MAG: M14 family zinc carboxypeptidase, partial [Actinomycetota bacterium]
MTRPMRLRAAVVALAVLSAGFALVGDSVPASAVPNPVATDAATYALYGRVWPDPHGCLSADTDGDEVNDVVAPLSSPWAKGNVCVAQFLTYEEFITGAKLLERLYPRFIDVIRLDEAFDNANFRSAGLGRMVAVEDGDLKLLGRDRRPLYMLKVTDEESNIPEDMRLHFAYSGSIHGIERAGAEGQIRAAEDLVTWAANLPNKKIVETQTKARVPTAAETLRRSVIYFVFPNPDGWARGSLAPIETQDGGVNANYTPGVYFHRYNGNGMDLNRDFPTVGYTYRPYTPGSNPETKAIVSVMRHIRNEISQRNPAGQRFAGGIDLHGQLVANAFSFTLMGAGRRDFKKNFATVDQGSRTWADQSARLAWSPYIGTLFETADQWGTVIDTIGYQVTGSLGDWFESEQVGLGAVGIDNEMSLSHLVPNTVFDPTTEQMHIDGNKGLIYSQLASTLTERKDQYRYDPQGKIGYVFNPRRVKVSGEGRVRYPSLPAQNDIDVLAPCQSVTQAVAVLFCDEEGVNYDAVNNAIEFTVKGPKDGYWNGGITAQMTNVNALSISAGTLGQIALERFDIDHPGKSGEDAGHWQTVQTSFTQAGNPDLYLPAGQDVVVNDPLPGRWRVRITNPLVGPSRLRIDFNRRTGELSPGQAKIDASSMDFFTDLNRYIPKASERAEAVPIDTVIANPRSLSKYDSLVVLNNVGRPSYVRSKLGLSADEAKRYFAGLRSYASAGGNLVLTDSALGGLPELGIGKASDVKARQVLEAGRFEFEQQCNKTPLTKKVCLPGTAGGTSRQAAEPTPLGYSPDVGNDNNRRRVMPEWYIRKSVWNSGAGCPSEDCTEGLVGPGAGLGERRLGK